MNALSKFDHLVFCIPKIDEFNPSRIRNDYEKLVVENSIDLENDWTLLVLGAGGISDETWERTDHDQADFVYMFTNSNSPSKGYILDPDYEDHELIFVSNKLILFDSYGNCDTLIISLETFDLSINVTRFSVSEESYIEAILSVNKFKNFKFTVPFLPCWEFKRNSDDKSIWDNANFSTLN